MQTPEMLLWRRIDVIGPDGIEVLGPMDAFSAIDGGRWAWFCGLCATASRASFRAVDRALRGHWDDQRDL